MKKITLFILGTLPLGGILLFKQFNPFSDSLTIEIPKDSKLTKETVKYLCDTGVDKEKVDVTYFNARNISLADFTWKGDRVVGANVISASGVKFMGGQYIWWTRKNEAVLYDLINDPAQENPTHCEEEK
ncbi:MliC family protein [Bartonella ancashensis]|uniref:Membrane-bound lysozyme inhibitor of c-type lysozyme n=1 Tax=Bartonella ancashensis TaxID=1318743 RepID=A0A0M3T2S3_9HYPH|nr:MliC family protein [Bartonella ancashensis]ALE03235.1 Membrane-bound lysozyme inhibitor of c-type lysozyme [Bartonella ancashensis]